MDTRYTKYKWHQATTFSGQEFLEFDFSDTDFDGVIFENSSFKNCKFHKGNPGSLAFFGCKFFGCHFSSFDFRRISVGANGGLFDECKFSRCNFTGRQFEYPHFNQCVFDNCKLKNINFNDSSFEKCSFIGKIVDTTFNGMYHKQSTGFKALENIDFSQATFGDFVTFEDCDLTTCIPPTGITFDKILYYIYKNNQKIRSTGTKDQIVIDQL